MAVARASPQLDFPKQGKGIVDRAATVLGRKEGVAVDNGSDGHLARRHQLELLAQRDLPLVAVEEAVGSCCRRQSRLKPDYR